MSNTRRSKHSSDQRKQIRIRGGKHKWNDEADTNGIIRDKHTIRGWNKKSEGKTQNMRVIKLITHNLREEETNGIREE